MENKSLAPGNRRLSLHLATEAYQNAWANHRLLKACAQLTLGTEQ